MYPPCLKCRCICNTGRYICIWRTLAWHCSQMLSRMCVVTLYFKIPAYGQCRWPLFTDIPITITDTISSVHQTLEKQKRHIKMAVTTYNDYICIYNIQWVFVSHIRVVFFAKAVYSLAPLHWLLPQTFELQ